MPVCGCVRQRGVECTHVRSLVGTDADLVTGILACSTGPTSKKLVPLSQNPFLCLHSEAPDACNTVEAKEQTTGI